MTRRRRRRRKKLLDDLQKRRGGSHLKEEALDRTMWRARFGRGFGPLVRETTKRLNPSYSLTVFQCGRNMYQSYYIQIYSPKLLRIMLVLLQ